MNPTLNIPIAFNRPHPLAATPTVQAIRDVFEEQITRGLHPGAQLVVLLEGLPLVDLAAGLTHRAGKRPVTPETIFLTFSVTKAFTAACIHRLVQDGKLAWDEPLATYWPAFGRNGKAAITLRHVMLHQAGLPMRGARTFFALWPFPRVVGSAIAAARPQFPPGERTAYHALNYGYILGELIRRVSGRPPEEYLYNTFLAPLGLTHTWLGWRRGWRWQRAGLSSGSEEQRPAALLFNLPFIRYTPQAAATLHSTARDMAIFYQMLLNGGQYAGQRLLEAATINQALELVTDGRDETMGARMRWALGYHLGGTYNRGVAVGSGMGQRSSQRTFGHFGHNSCMAWADRDAQLVVAFTVNQLLDRVPSAARWQAISDAVWAVVA
jgi:CubicO group peptidase (beta-lactamase class C family)